MDQLNSYQTACIIAGIIDEKKASDIVILDISKVSIMADYFVICSTETSTQLRTLSEHIIYDLKHNFQRITKSEQKDLSDKWYLLDYGDVIVHVLHQEAREYYAIEKFWSHAFVVEENKWKEEYNHSVECKAEMETNK
ncbi:MAG: ribosome silencing factor [Cyanobacteriota bacterium]